MKKGTKMTEEAVQKIRDASLRQWQNPEKRAKLIANHKGTTGKKYSDETKQKMSAWQTGRQMSDEARTKMSIAKKGKQSRFLNGDTNAYSKRTRSGHYIWAKSVKKRDNYTCQICNLPYSKSNLTAHHINSYANFPELRIDVNNGLTLCVPCHRYTHRTDHNIS